MESRISFRDFEFHSSTTGVRIIIYTDIPCHLFCRLTTEPPHIHKKPVLLRGVRFNDDVRFCFTVFEDNEQFEAGDTLVHTWWKPDWAVCTTKWCYIWGTVGGVVSSSTSAILTYHNDGIEPLPPPDVLKTFNEIEPNYRTIPTSHAWTELDLSYELHEDATGVIIQVLNLDPGQERQVGMRKAGITYDVHRDMRRKTMTWAMCGVNSDRKIEVYAELHTHLQLWIMGYTNRNVQFLDTPIDILPIVPDVWKDIDISVSCPGAIGVILNVGRMFGGTAFFACRMKGSTDDRYKSTWQTWPVVGVDANGIFQIKMRDLNPVLSSAYVIGYITQGATFATNGIDISPTINDNWQARSIDHFPDKPRWGIIEGRGIQADRLYGAQKYLSRRDLLWNTYVHDWQFVHCNWGSNVELYCQAAGIEFRLIGVTH